ncbi:TetR/AcrR family transcriptional regulator [Maricaulis sp.]|uniref:TetR/AcrR family transcriptional regulator n=1 Tax=unclassified Maricaulis TaxID=2632371 RepID=UPI001B25D179|nr:TetR/AcrR family transcriptional regulator [Maricaulis sp.]MBO6795884.1 TetR/AcrR family transcriptional regulator [Maricaulis sp.]
MNERAPIEGVNLQRRVAPQQKRSQQRIREIVEATKRLLERGEGESITTSVVAAEAGVPVSSVYRYFPNIYSIHQTLLEEYKSATDDIIGERLNDPEETEWQVSLTGMISGLRTLVDENPSYGAVLRLTLTTHELRSVREEWNLRLADQLASRWRDGADGFSGGDPDLVARMTVEIYSAAEILMFENRENEKKAEAIFNEALIALRRYLGNYLE